MTSNLSPRFNAIDEIKALNDDELKAMAVSFTEDILALRDRLIARGELYTNCKGAVALKHLKRSREWITKEIKAREAVKRKAEEKEAAERKLAAQIAHAEAEKAAAAAKKEGARIAKQIQKDAAKAKLERIKEANSQDMREIGVFKEVCREVIGLELYSYLWEETRRRVASA